MKYLLILVTIGLTACGKSNSVTVQSPAAVITQSWYATEHSLADQHECVKIIDGIFAARKSSNQAGLYNTDECDNHDEIERVSDGETYEFNSTLRFTVNGRKEHMVIVVEELR